MRLGLGLGLGESRVRAEDPEQDEPWQCQTWHRLQDSRRLRHACNTPRFWLRIFWVLRVIPSKISRTASVLKDTRKPTHASFLHDVRVL